MSVIPASEVVHYRDLTKAHRKELLSAVDYDELQQYDRQVFREPEVLKFAGYKDRTHLARLIKQGDFAAPIKLTDTGRAKAWLGLDLLVWREWRRLKRDAAVKAA